MKILILLAAIAGLTHGYQVGLEYKYRYSGTLQTGIPDIKNQAAASVIEADVIFQVTEKSGPKNNGIAMVQITNIKVGEYNGNVGCDYRGDIPIELREVDWGRFEEPFLITILGSEDDSVLCECEEDLLWKTNLKKAIVSVMKNQVLMSNFPLEHSTHLHETLRGTAVPVFTVNEETLFGNCQVEYQLQKLPEYFAGSKKIHFDKRIIKDIQLDEITTKSPIKTGKKYSSKSRTKYRPKGKPKGKPSSPITKVIGIENELWHLARSVEFDECAERVEFQKTPVGFREMLGKSQYKWTRSRSSSSDYILRGSPGAFRVEEVTVVGGLTMAPFGMKSDLLEASTNQSLKLISVDSPRQRFPRTYVHCTNTWMQQVNTFAPSPAEAKSHEWVIYGGKDLNLRPLSYFTGMQSFWHVTENITMKIREKIDAAVLELTDLDQEVKSSPGAIVDNLFSAGELLDNLNSEKILNIFDHYYSKSISQSDALSQLMVVDVAASSPFPDGLEAILQYANDGKIKDSQMATVFMSLTSSLSVPNILPKILDYVLNLDIDSKPFLTSIIYLNTANLINKFCNNDVNYYKIPIDVMGDAGLCDQSQITDRVIPALERLLESSSSWKQTLAVLTLQSMGTPLSIPILAPIIMGTSKRDSRVRISAIYGLERWKLPRSTRGQAMLMLKDVISNYGEPAEVRQSALATLVSWGPEASYWQQLARSTWRDPSKQMVAFISSTLESFSKQTSPLSIRESQIAYHALRYAKKITPSAKYSYNLMTSTNIIKRFIGKFDNLAWISNEVDPVPHQFYYFLLTSMGGFEMINYEFWIATDGLSHFLNAMAESRMTVPTPSTISSKIAWRFYSKIMDDVLPESNARHNAPQANIWIKLLENAIAFFPINRETLGSMGMLDMQWLYSLGIKLTLGHDLVLAKYVNPLSLNSFLPSEFGTPVITTVSSPMLFSSGSFTTVGKITPGPLKKIKFESEILVKVSTKTESRLKVYIPWQESAISTGVYGIRDLVVPLTLNFDCEAVDKEDSTSMTLTTLSESIFEKEFKFLHASNNPFTSIEPLFPLALAYYNEVRSADIKLVAGTIRKNKIIPKIPVLNELGVEVTWKSNIKNPFTLFSSRAIFDELDGYPLLLFAIASPTTRMWELEITLEDPKSAKVEIEKSCTLFLKKKGPVHTGQETQSQGTDYSQYDQDSHYDDFQKSQNSFSGFDGFDDQSQESVESVEVETQIPTKGVNWGDNKQQRAEKLKDKYGGTMKTCSIKMTIKGETTSSYETIMTWVKSVNKISHKKVFKGQLQLLRSPVESDPNPALLCIDVTRSTPVFSDFDTLESIRTKDLNINLTVEVSAGCKGIPVLSLEGSQSLSSEALAVFDQNHHQICDFDKYDPMQTFMSTTFYDRVHLNLNWREICNFQSYPLTTSLIEILENFKISHCSKVKSDSDDRHIHFSAQRESNSERWDVGVERGDSTSLHQYIEFEEDSWQNEVIHDLTSVKQFDLDCYGDDIVSSKCVLGVDYARTFDGFTYSYTPTECWTVAVTEFLSHENGFLILTRSGRGEKTIPEVRLIDVNRGLVVDMADGEVKVNGKVIDPIDGKEVINDSKDECVLGVVKKSGDFTQFKILHPEVRITVKDSVYISLGDEYLGLTRGMCGYYDGEPEAEMIGPKGCYYADPNKHAEIWTGQSDTCDFYTLVGRKSDVEEYQSDCKPIYTMIEEASVNTEWCLKYGENTRKLSEWTSGPAEPDPTCTSVEPVPYCNTDEGCLNFETYLQQVELRCSYESSNPEDSTLRYEYVHVPKDCRMYEQTIADEEDDDEGVKY